MQETFQSPKRTFLKKDLSQTAIKVEESGRQVGAFAPKKIVRHNSNDDLLQVRQNARYSI